MLVLGRKVGESLHISGQIKVTVIMTKGNSVKIGIEAPDDVRIMRSELDDWTELSFEEPQPLKPDLNDCPLTPDGPVHS